MHHCANVEVRGEKTDNKSFFAEHRHCSVVSKSCRIGKAWRQSLECQYRRCKWGNKEKNARGGTLGKSTSCDLPERQVEIAETLRLWRSAVKLCTRTSLSLISVLARRRGVYFSLPVPRLMCYLEIQGLRCVSSLKNGKKRTAQHIQPQAGRYEHHAG